MGKNPIHFNILFYYSVEQKLYLLNFARYATIIIKTSVIYPKKYKEYEYD